MFGFFKNKKSILTSQLDKLLIQFETMTKGEASYTSFCVAVLYKCILSNMEPLNRFVYSPHDNNLSSDELVEVEHQLADLCNIYLDAAKAFNIIEGADLEVKYNLLMNGAAKIIYYSSLIPENSIYKDKVNKIWLKLFDAAIDEFDSAKIEIGEILEIVIEDMLIQYEMKTATIEDFKKCKPDYVRL